MKFWRMFEKQCKSKVGETVLKDWKGGQILLKYELEGLMQYLCARIVWISERGLAKDEFLPERWKV